MTSRLLPVFIVLFAFSCKNSSSENKRIDDYIVEKIQLDINRTTEPSTRALQYLNGDLYWWNSDRETIQVFDINSKKLTRTITLASEGPNGVGMPLGFFVYNKDSIYIPTGALELRLLNSTGELRDIYSYYEYSELGVPVGSITRYSLMIQKDPSDNLYLLMRDIQNIEPGHLNTETLEKFPPILVFEPTKNKFSFNSFRTPSSILSFDDQISYMQTSSSKSLLLLHQQSNLLFEIDFDRNNSTEVLLETNLLNSFTNSYYKSPRRSRSIEENTRVMYSGSKNLGIAYDPYKNLLYRFGWPGDDISGDKDAMKFGYTPRFFTISIYDGTDFELLSEFILPKNTYLSHHFFVSEKGLNLFPMHPDNPEFNENELTIHTFDFSSLLKN